MAKRIDTLVEDMQRLFGDGHIFNHELLTTFTEGLYTKVGDRLQEHLTPRGISNLRMSNLGKPDRQLWFETHRGAEDREALSASAKIKFLFGDILELFLLYLAEEAGHKVEYRQRKVEADGVPGSIDCFIDDVLVDAKSASSFSFEKFKDGSLVMDDPFGYIEQLAGYSYALGGVDGGFLVIDKTLGHICFMPVSAKELAAIDIQARIVRAKEVVALEHPPPRCFDPKSDGKSGNLALGTNCSYCPFKKECWQDANNGIGLRTFLYSSGPKYLVHVEREPQVMEVTF